MTTPLAEFEREANDILPTFARRVESMPHGKTYDWEQEVSALSQAAIRYGYARVDEFVKILFGPVTDENRNYYPGRDVSATDIEDALAALRKQEGGK